MKRLYLFLLITICFIFGGLSKVNAEDLDVLAVFVDDQSTIIVNVTSGEVNETPLRNVKTGDSIVFDARICKITESMASGAQASGYIFLSKSDCTATTATWTNSNDSVLTMNNNVGIVKGYGTTTITASANGLNYSVTYTITNSTSNNGSSSSNTNTNTNTNTTTNTTTTKTTTSTNSTSYNDSNFTSDVVTSENPSTGLSDILVYIIPISIIGGSILVFRKRMA